MPKNKIWTIYTQWRSLVHEIKDAVIKRASSLTANIVFYGGYALDLALVVNHIWRYPLCHRQNESDARVLVPELGFHFAVKEETQQALGHVPSSGEDVQSSWTGGRPLSGHWRCCQSPGKRTWVDNMVSVHWSFWAEVTGASELWMRSCSSNL